MKNNYKRSVFINRKKIFFKKTQIEKDAVKHKQILTP